jgi:hypothetical protein
VFRRHEGTWTQQAYLKAGNAQAGDNFGVSVAISGDTVVVGAISEDSLAPGVNSTPNESASAAGAAYVFTRSGTTWTQQAYSKASNPGYEDRFGTSVAVSGDTVVVSSPFEDSEAAGVGGDQDNNSLYNPGAAYVFTRSGTTWTQEAYLKASNPGFQDQFGKSVALSGDTVVIGAANEDSDATGIGGNQTSDSAFDSGAAYVFTRSGTTWTQQAYLKASNTGLYDQFGSSVAVSENTIVIGAMNEDSNATGVGGDQANNSADECGAAYVFTRSGGVWSQQAYLKASNAEAYDKFGFAVAVSGKTIVVGALSDDSDATGIDGAEGNNNAVESGAAYVFISNGTTWSQQAFLKASNAESADYFGLAVAVSEELVVVGADGESGGATGVNGDPASNSAIRSGAAYTYSLTHPLEIEQPEGTPLAEAELSDFGVIALGASSPARTFTLVNSGTRPLTGLTVGVEGPNPGDFSVSALSATTVPPGGSVTFTVTFTPGGTDFRSCTLTYSDDAWPTQSVRLGGFGLGPRLLEAVQQAYAKPAAVGATQAGDTFGFSVAVSGDTVVVSANLEDSSSTGVNSTPNDLASSAGAVYVFTRSGSTWTQQAYLKASNAAANDFFGGNGVAISGDTIVVGARGESSSATGINGNQADNSATSSGAAYVFTRSGTTWTQQAYLKASNSAGGDAFGSSVAVSGDTVVVGAWFEDSNAAGVNGDQSNNSAASAGAAYVFTRSGTTWTQQAYLKASNPGVSDEFGGSVAVSGDTIVVGASNEASSATGIGGNQADNSAGGSGAAYVFTRSGTTWTQQAYIKASNTDANDQFGDSVAASGDTVVVGAAGEDSMSTGVNGAQTDGGFLQDGSGAAYVFTRDGTTWTQQAYLKSSYFNPGNSFGASVAVSGDTVVVGATGEDSNATGVNGNPANTSAGSSGAAYVFKRVGSVWTHQVYLKASNTGASDGFGNAVAVSGDTVVVAASNEDSNAPGINGDQTDNSSAAAGAAYIFAGIPEIALRGNGVNIVNNDLTPGAADHTDFGLGTLGGTEGRTFTIANSGGRVLSLTGTPRVALSGSSAFSVTTQPAAVVEGNGTQNFVITLDRNVQGNHQGTITISNDDLDENPFTFAIKGISLFQTSDTDGDGLNDLAEYQMALQGYDWQVSQPALVTSLLSNLWRAHAELNEEGYFTAAQVQALHVGTPLIQRDAVSGKFTLTIGVWKSATLLSGSYTLFPMTVPQTVINGDGELEFEFTAPGDTAFFRLESE